MIFLPVVVMAAFFLQSCSKSGSDSNTNSFRKPNTILVNWEYNGSTWVRNGYMLLDLDHADNKDKSYMIVNIEPNGSGGFKFVLKQGPLPIDSLASNWPAEVRSAGFGYGNDMTVNAAMRLQAQTNTRPYTYRYDSIHKFSTGIATYNYLNNPVYAGVMAGKAPQGRAVMYGPDGSGNSMPRDIIFYFKEGYASNILAPGTGAQPFTSIVNGVPTVISNGSGLDAVLTIEGPVFLTFYFDFDEWQFFYFWDSCPSVNGAPCTGGTVQVSDYQSMNNLMNWPAGWGKQ